jgi:hypothetical protein
MSQANVKLSEGPPIRRHTFCLHLAMRGAPAKAIQELAIRLLNGRDAAAGFGEIVETTPAAE